MHLYINNMLMYEEVKLVLIKDKGLNKHNLRLVIKLYFVHKL